MGQICFVGVKTVKACVCVLIGGLSDCEQEGDVRRMGSGQPGKQSLKEGDGDEIIRIISTPSRTSKKVTEMKLFELCISTPTTAAACRQPKEGGRLSEIDFFSPLTVRGFNFLTAVLGANLWSISQKNLMTQNKFGVKKSLAGPFL